MQSKKKKKSNDLKSRVIIFFSVVSENKATFWTNEQTKT